MPDNTNEKTNEELLKELEASKKEAEKAKKEAEASKKEAEKAKNNLEATKKELVEAKNEIEAVEKEAEAAEKETESGNSETLVIHRKATWCTRIGRNGHVINPGYNRFDDPMIIKDIKESDAWNTETKANPLNHGKPNMVEIVVEEEKKESFAKTISGMNAEEAIELIGNHGGLEDVQDVLKSDNRKTVKEAAKEQIENIRSREK